MMKCICGFVRPTSGTVTVAGKQIGKDCDFPESVGLIIEAPGFIPYYSGYKNLKLLADLNRRISKEDIRKTMQQVGIKSDCLRRPILHNRRSFGFDCPHRVDQRNDAGHIHLNDLPAELCMPAQNVAHHSVHCAGVC